MRISDWSSDVCSSDFCLNRRSPFEIWLLENTAGRSDPFGTRLIDRRRQMVQAACGKPIIVTLLLRSGDNPGKAISRTLLKRRVTMIGRSEEHTSELQSLMRISYAVFCLKNKKYT